MDSLAYSFQLPQRSPNTMAQQRASEVVDQAAQQPSAQDMDLISPTKGLLQTGVDGEEAYYTAWQNMNNFAMEMAGKYGIDVTRPDPSSPEAIDAYRQFNRLYSTARQRGMQLRTGYETQEAINQAYLRGDILRPAFMDEGRITTSQDPLRVLPAKLDEPVDSFNKMMDNTSIVTQQDLQQAQSNRQGLIDFYTQDVRNSLIEQGVDPRDVDRWVDLQVKSLRQPTIDRYKAASLSMERERLNLQRDEQTKPPEENQGAFLRKQAIGYFQNFDQSPEFRDQASQTANAMRGGKSPGGGYIQDVMFVDFNMWNNALSKVMRIANNMSVQSDSGIDRASQLTPDNLFDKFNDDITSQLTKEEEAILEAGTDLGYWTSDFGNFAALRTAYGSGAQQGIGYESIDLTDPGSYQVINNVLNTVPSQEKYSMEDFAKVPEAFSFNTGQQQSSTQPAQQQQQGNTPKFN